MANHPITIEGINADGTLDLSDKGITKVDGGDTVTWKIGNKSGVAVITGIIRKPGTIDLFAPNDPAPVGGSTHWQGIVNEKVERDSVEDYTIDYIKVEGNERGSFDPKIQVNS